MQNTKRGLFFKSLLSLWIVYHLFVVIVMSNAGSFVGRHFQAFITPYANITGFNTSWNFFSPDPAHTMYLKYLVYFEDEEGKTLKDHVVGFLPAEKNVGTFDNRRRRELYMMHYLILSPERIENLFVPHICKSHPGASHVRVDFVVESIAPLDEAATFDQESMADLSKKTDYIQKEYHCHAE